MLILSIVILSSIVAAQTSPQGGGSSGSSDPYSISNLGTSCSSLSGTGLVNCFVAGNQLGGGYGYGTCLISPGEDVVPSVGYCYFLNESFSATFYTYNAGNGKIVRSPLSGSVQNPVPVVKDVINNNNKYSPYLITCPLPPQPTNSIEYISDPGTFIAGNRCLASIVPLITTVSLTTTVSITGVGFFYNLAGFTGGSAPTSASSSYTIAGFSKGSLTNLGFSGETTQDGSAYNISPSYNSKSYIFQQVNSSPQQGLWTWSADYANLAAVPLKYLNLNFDSSSSSVSSDLNAFYTGIDLGIEYDTYIPLPVPVPVGCSFTYNFDVHSQISELSNTNIPIPIYNKTAGNVTNNKNYLKIGLYLYSPVWTQSSRSGCYGQMLSGGGSCSTRGGSAILHGIGIGAAPTTSNWLKISTNGTAYYNGQTYNNLPVFLNATDAQDINSLGTYYGALIGCEPLQAYNAQHGISTHSRSVSGTYCGVVAYLPQTITQTSAGAINTKQLTQFLGGELGLVGSSSSFITLTAPSTGGGSFFSSPTVSSQCSGYNAQRGINNQNGYTASYSSQTANSQTGYPITYCVSFGSQSIFNGGSQTPLAQTACQNVALDPLSCALYVSVSTNPIGNQALPLTFIVPINRSGTNVLLQTNTVVGVDTANVQIFPYFTYQAQIPSTEAQFTPATYLNLFYDTYSPNNYASTTNVYGVLTTPVEPFNLQSGGGLLANFSSPGRTSELVDFPLSAAAATSNGFYDEYPIAISGSTVQIKTPIPLPTPLSNTLVFNNINANPFAANSLLQLPYQPNNVIYMAALLNSTSGLPTCVNDSAGGACLGAVTYDGSLSLTSNLFIFGNVTIDPGVVVQTNGYALITNVPIPDTSQIIVGYKPTTFSLTNHGTLGFTNITSPAFVTESPNGYVYVINYTATSCWYCLSTTSKAYLFKMKYIPTGDYNYSTYTPSQFQNQTSLNAWLTQTNNYFKGSLLAHTPSLYIVSSSQFSETSTPNWCLFSLCIGSVSPGAFIPLAAQADYQGDLFLIGAPISGAYPTGTSGKTDFALAEMTAGGSVLIDNAISQPAGFVPSQEFAVSPSGGFLYLANASWPAINIYSTQGGNFQYVGNIPLSYSNATSNLNIHTYLAHGGPFYSNQIASAYQTSYAMNDQPMFHHPIAISDVQGTLFVIDNWTFGPTSSQSDFKLNPFAPGTYTTTLTNPLGSIWMLRAFEENGTIEIPLEYSTNDTVVPIQSTAPQRINPLVTANVPQLWPPFGQPLSANITLDSGLLSGSSGQSDSGPYVSICEYTGTGGCTLRGNTIGMNSIGPLITVSGQVFGQNYDEESDVSHPLQLGISSGFGGSMYLMIHDTVPAQPYTQLLTLQPEVQNYTTIEVGQGVPYQCLINTSTTSAPDCIPSNFISGLYPPLIAMPDAFEYLTAQGTATQYFSIPSALSALLPVGANDLQKTSSAFNTGNMGGGADYNSIATGDLANTPVTNNALLRTYINSTVSGYVITPYSVTKSLSQSWDFSGSDSGSGSGGNCQDSGGDGTCEFELNVLSATLLEGVCDFNPDPKSSSSTIYTQWVTKLSSNFINQTVEGGQLFANYTATQSIYQPNLSDKNLILPPDLEISLFSNRLLGEVYINQTISSAQASQISSQLEANAGQSLASMLGGAGSALGSLLGVGPKVVNASRNDNYTEDIYVQIYSPTVSGLGGFNPLSTVGGSALSGWATALASGGCTGSSFCAPAYLAENAIPTSGNALNYNQTLMGANCGGKGCPSTLPGTAANLLGLTIPAGQLGALTGLSGYYYASSSSNLLGSNNILNYSETIGTEYVSLFSLFHRLAYTYGLDLNVSNVPLIYGYNRLMYTYVDRYNNTIYMPVDVDFANTTVISVATSVAVNTTNFNQSTIGINGIFDYVTPWGTIEPAPAGSTVYLYYDTNLNYYNTSAITTLAGGASNPLSDSYYKWAENCAFDPQSTACVTANPLSTYGLGSLLTGLLAGQTQSQLQSLATSALESLSNKVTYHPNYASSGSCATPPNSLLAIDAYNCNIHGSTLTGLLPSSPASSALGLPSVVDNNGNIQYCVPLFSNGTGYLTSQIGLIGTVTTNSAGDFNDIITACGVGTGMIVAQYYGYPSPEPIDVAQPSLQHSANPPSGSGSQNVISSIISPANYVITPEYNYYYAPNSTSSIFQYGAYQLNLGDLYAWIPIIIIIALVLASKSALGQNGGLFELMGFSTLIDMSAGIGSGSGKRGKGLRSQYKASSLSSTFFDRLTNVREAKQTIVAKESLIKNPVLEKTGLSGAATIGGSNAPPSAGILGGIPPKLAAGAAVAGGAPVAGAGFINMAMKDVKGRVNIVRQRAAAAKKQNAVIMQRRAEIAAAKKAAKKAPKQTENYNRPVPPKLSELDKQDEKDKLAEKQKQQKDIASQQVAEQREKSEKAEAETTKKEKKKADAEEGQNE